MDKVFRAIAHPARRKILELLRFGPLSAGALAVSFDFSKPTLSAHLAKLLAADLVCHERVEGGRVYRINTSVVEDALSGLFKLLGLNDSRRASDVS